MCWSPGAEGGLVVFSKRSGNDHQVDGATPLIQLPVCDDGDLKFEL